MKEFKVWWRENSWKFTCRERSPDRIAEEAWRAALAWHYSDIGAGMDELKQEMED